MKNRSWYEGYLMGNTENAQYNYMYRPAADNKKSFLAFTVSVMRPFSQKNDQGFYPRDFFSFKAFGAQADFINNNFKPGDPIQVEGYEVMEPGREKEDGTKYAPRKVTYVTSIDFVTNRRENNGESHKAATTTTASAPVSDDNFFADPF